VKTGAGKGGLQMCVYMYLLIGGITVAKCIVMLMQIMAYLSRQHRISRAYFKVLGCITSACRMHGRTKN